VTGGIITANLPSRDFDRTAEFYGRLGFEPRFRDAGWMILGRERMVVEFFPHPELDPRASWFSACIRTADIDALHAEWSTLGLPANPREIPRLTAPSGPQGNVPRMFALVDPDGSLWRVLETESSI